MLADFLGSGFQGGQRADDGHDRQRAGQNGEPVFEGSAVMDLRR